MLRPILGETLPRWRYKTLLLTSAAAYWILYAFSSGMIFYYSTDVTPLLRGSGVPNPYFVNFHTFRDSYFSGMIWYPNGHVQLNLLYGPTFFSVVLSVLYSLSMPLLIYGFANVKLDRSSGLKSFFGIVPALFSGGCCAVPFGIQLISAFAPSVLFFSFVYNYVLFTNLSVSSFMLISLAYNYRKVARASCIAGSDRAG